MNPQLRRFWSVPKKEPAPAWGNELRTWLAMDFSPNGTFPIENLWESIDFHWESIDFDRIGSILANKYRPKLALNLSLIRP